MEYRTVATAAVFEKMEMDPDFYNFVIGCMDRFFSGDYGEIQDPEENTEEDKLAVYVFSDKTKIWIKQDFNVVTVLFPSDY